MTPETVQLWSTVAQVALSFAALIASVAIPLVIYYGQRRLARLEYIRSMRDSWLTIDTAVIHDERLMKLADEVNDPSAGELSADDRTRKWFGYMFMNIAFADFLGSQYRLNYKGALTQVRSGLKNLLRCSAVRSIVEAYPPDFRALCSELIAELDAEASEDGQERSRDA
jgi:hypothetical protein